MADQHPVYVIKKKGGHAGHHGGAWKVAYADFVTAMMALFIVLWLLNTSKQVQEAIGIFQGSLGLVEASGLEYAGIGRELLAYQTERHQVEGRIAGEDSQGLKLREAEQADRDDDHGGRPAYRTAGNRERNILRSGERQSEP